MTVSLWHSSLSLSLSFSMRTCSTSFGKGSHYWPLLITALFFTPATTACSNGECQVSLSISPSSRPDPFIPFPFSSQFWAEFSFGNFAQLLESCSTATDCGPGLYCGNCPSLEKNQPFCIRGQAPIPTSIVTCFSFYFNFLLYHVNFLLIFLGINNVGWL